VSANTTAVFCLRTWVTSLNGITKPYAWSAAIRAQPRMFIGQMRLRGVQPYQPHLLLLPSDAKHRKLSEMHRRPLTVTGGSPAKLEVANYSAATTGIVSAVNTRPGQG